MTEQYLKNKEYFKKYYETNKTELLKKQKIYDDNRREKKVEYYKANKDKRKAYYQANRERLLEYQKKKRDEKKANQLTSDTT